MVACGALALLTRRNRLLAADARAAGRAQRGAGRPQLGAQGGRGARRSFLEAQGDFIVRRDADGRITYANDAFCALAGRAPRRAARQRFRPAAARAGRSARCPTARACTTRRSRPPTARAGSPGAKSRCATMAGAREIQSVGRDVTDRTAGRAGAGRSARPGGSRQPRQVTLPRHGVARNPHAAERHPRHGGSAARHPADARAGDLCQGGEDLRRHAAVADRGDPRLLQDRSRQARPRARPFALVALVEEAVELLAPRAQAKGAGDRRPTSTSACPSRCRRRRAAAPGAAQSCRQRGEVHRDAAASRIMVEPGAWPDEIRFTVRDTGIGIAPDAQARIFQRIRAGRRRHDAQVRRHRPRPCHLPAHRRAHGRQHRRWRARRARARPSASPSRCRAPRRATPFAAPDLAARPC